MLKDLNLMGCYTFFNFIRSNYAISSNVQKYTKLHKKCAKIVRTIYIGHVEIIFNQKENIQEDKNRTIFQWYPFTRLKSKNWHKICCRYKYILRINIRTHNMHIWGYIMNCESMSD